MTSGPISATGITVNQAIQNDDVSIPLIAGKGAWVRVSVKSDAGDVDGVDGRLRVTDSNGNTRSYQPTNDPIVARPSGSEPIQWSPVDLVTRPAGDGFQQEPVWLSQTQTNKDPSFVRTRMRDADAEGMQVALETSAANTTNAHGAEEIGWLAVERGSGGADGTRYAAERTGSELDIDAPVVRAFPLETVQPNRIENDDFAFLVDEGTQTFSANTPVDLTAPGSVSPGSGATQLGSAGTYQSYFLHFDPEGQGNQETLAGEITFSEPVVAVISGASSLAVSDAVVRGNRPLPTSSSRSIDANDAVALAPDGRTLEVDLTAKGGADQLRVLTQDGAERPQATFDTSFTDPPTFLAGLSTYDGDDPAGLRRVSKDTDSAQVKVDDPDGHKNEMVDYLALGGDETITGYPYAPNTQPSTTIRTVGFDADADNSGQVTTGVALDLPEIPDSPLDPTSPLDADSGPTVRLARDIREIPIGDTDVHAESHGLLQFPLGEVPKGIDVDDITKAELSLTFSDPIGNPAFGPIVVDRADYGSSVDATDFRTKKGIDLLGEAGTFTPDPGGGRQTLDITSALKNELNDANPTDPLQLALYHKSVSDDGAADYNPLLTGNAEGDTTPRLDISYEEETLEPRPIGETGTVSGLTTTTQTIRFDNTYDNPVVFARPATNNGSDVIAVRVQNVTKNDFELRLQEPLGAPHSKNESVDWAVIEAGSWQLRDGTHIEAGKQSTDITANDADRHANGTLNFRIPGNEFDGQLNLDAEISSSHASTTSGAQRTVQASTRDILVFNQFDVHYTAEGMDATPDGNAPTVFAGSGSFAERTLPTEEVAFSNAYGEINFGRDLSDSAGSDADRDSNWSRLLNKVSTFQLANQQNPGNPVAPIPNLAIVPDVVASPGNPGTTVGKARSITLARQDPPFAAIEDREATFAHEVGHVIGRGHAPGPGNPDDQETDFPVYTRPDGTAYTYGSIGGPGLQPTSPSNSGPDVRDPETVYDLMSYAGDDDVWIAPHTYKAIANTLQPGISFPLQATQESGADGLVDALTLSGWIDSDAGEAEFGAAFAGQRSELSAPETDGPYALVVRGESGDVLLRHPFKPGKAAVVGGDGNVGNNELFTLSIPKPGAAAAELQLVTLDDEADGPLVTRTITPNPPSAELTASRPAPATLADGLTLSVDTSDPDGGDLTSMLQFSPDGGKTWEPFVYDVRGETREVDPDDLPATENGAFRLVTSDGVNTRASVLEGPYRVPNTPPAPAINKTGRAGDDGLILAGGANDMEDGSLAADQLLWSSNRAGELGRGEEVVARDLGPGPHTVTLTATDSAGGSGQTRVDVTVGETFDVADIPPQAQIAALYVGYYSRPPGRDGIGFWTDLYNERLRADSTAEEVTAEFASRFADVAESREAYPFLDNPTADGTEAFVTRVFDQLFNRDPSPEALAFYRDRLLERLEADAPIGDVLLDIINGAAGPDATVLENKVDVALAAKNELEPTAFEDATQTGQLADLLADVGEADASLTEARGQIEAIGNGETAADAGAELA